MKQTLASLLLIGLLIGCAAPTPAPTAVPTAPPAAPSRTLPARSPAAPASPMLAVQDVQQTRQPDGNIRATAKVTAAENLGLGQIDLAYPEMMPMGESRTIRLKLSPAQQLAGMTPVAAPAKTPDLPSFVYKFGGNVDLYPLMIAELHALKFDVKPTGPLRRTVDPKKEVIWDWLISPTAPGRQDLAIELAIPARINGVESELSTDVLKNLSFAVEVQAVQPSPVSRIIDSIIANAGPILVALITLLGTLIGIYAKIRSDKAKPARSSKK